MGKAEVGLQQPWYSLGNPADLAEYSRVVEGCTVYTEQLHLPIGVRMPDIAVDLQAVRQNLAPILCGSIALLGFYGERNYARVDPSPGGHLPSRIFTQRTTPYSSKIDPPPENRDGPRTADVANRCLYVGINVAEIVRVIGHEENNVWEQGYIDTHAWVHHLNRAIRAGLIEQITATMTKAKSVGLTADANVTKDRPKSTAVTLVSVLGVLRLKQAIAKTRFLARAQLDP